MQIHRIESLDLPQLAPYRTLRQHEEHRRAGIFVAEGDKVVRRLLESDFGVASVLLPEKRRAEFEPLIASRSEDIPLFVIPLEALEELIGFPFFQGVLAVGKIPRTHTLETLLRETPQPRLFVAVDGLSNAENIGLIVRNAVAFGAQGLIVSETCSSPFLRRAVRNSMGAIFKLPVVEATDLPAALQALRGQGIHCIAAHPHTDQRSIRDCDFGRDCCLVLGSEGSGISAPVLAACDEWAAIPMNNAVDSLNVASAAAVFLYEAAKATRSPSE